MPRSPKITQKKTGIIASSVFFINETKSPISIKLHKPYSIPLKVDSKQKSWRCSLSIKGGGFDVQEETSGGDGMHALVNALRRVGYLLDQCGRTIVQVPDTDIGFPIIVSGYLPKTKRNRWKKAILRAEQNDDSCQSKLANNLDVWIDQLRDGSNRPLK